MRQKEPSLLREVIQAYLNSLPVDRRQRLFMAVILLLDLSILASMVWGSAYITVVLFIVMLALAFTANSMKKKWQKQTNLERTDNEKN